MTDDGRRAALLSRAEALATELHDAKVKRSEVTSAINAMLYSQGPWNVRAARGRELAETLPVLWMKGRGATVPERLRKVREVVTQILSEYETEREVRFLLGWTLRLLRIKDPEST